MNKQRFSIWIKNLQNLLFLLLLMYPLTLHASFIESTIGTAVVNDATATYYNPAALTLVKSPQIITLGSIAYFHSHFTGQSTQAATGFTLSGSTSAHTNYYLPSLYLGIPTTNKVTAGLAIISNIFNRDIGENSILRYDQSSNSTQNIDFVPAVGIKLTECLSLGAGLNISYAKFLSKPTLGFPSLNIPDNQSHNESRGMGLGADVGCLFKPSRSTLIGFNYRSAITYHLSGTSIFESNPEVISNRYNFNFWTPARSVLSINHFVTKSLGFIGTVQRIQWSIFKNININGIATRIGSRSNIVNASVPHHLHDAWLLTVGSHYRFSPQWVVRIAASYNQSPGNSFYQISNGDSIILGGSVGYEIYKNIIIDGSYAHAFIQNENIHIRSRSIITGVNKGFRDAISLKLTVNLC